MNCRVNIEKGQQVNFCTGGGDRPYLQDLLSHGGRLYSICTGRGECADPIAPGEVKVPNPPEVQAAAVSCIKKGWRVPALLLLAN